MTTGSVFFPTNFTFENCSVFSVTSFHVLLHCGDCKEKFVTNVTLNICLSIFIMKFLVVPKCTHIDNFSGTNVAFEGFSVYIMGHFMSSNGHRVVFYFLVTKITFVSLLVDFLMSLQIVFWTFSSKYSVTYVA